MRQILQSLKTGQITLGDVPCPITEPGHLLIRSVASLISAGTERMLVEFGKANLLNKARQQPDKVRMVLDLTNTRVTLAHIESFSVRRHVEFLRSLF